MQKVKIVKVISNTEPWTDIAVGHYFDIENGFRYVYTFWSLQIDSEVWLDSGLHADQREKTQNISSGDYHLP